jgi:hypothetical protein
VTEPKAMTVAEPGLSRRARRTLVGFLSVYLVLYLATWMGGYRSHAQELKDKAEANYLTYEQWFRVREENALRHGLRASDLTRDRMNLQRSGSKYGISWCVPLLPGAMVVDSYSSTGAFAVGHGIMVGRDIGIVTYYGPGPYKYRRLSFNWHD